mmetsp:Transcript_5865/g.15470  ORF Transcript_5865/g.15470 Transcript_5865/m.15470 type:complete len:319 (+) Transcript_5865:426-1382(+)
MAQSLRVAAALLSLETVFAGSTCAELKHAYQDSTCCNAELGKVTNYNVASAVSTPLDCANAEVQTPRDLSPGAVGTRPAKAVVLNDAQAHKLPQTNVHFHLGAEHKSEYYSDSADFVAYDNAVHRRRQLASNPRPGFMCPTHELTAGELAPYTFHHCSGVSVGKSFEVHYVHSTAGTGDDATPSLSDGLGTAAAGRGLANPMVAVEAMIFQVVNSNDPSVTYTDLVHGWDVIPHNGTNSVMYAGSTTGGSYNNTVCSPYAITWHVDKRCHKVSAASFDKMCEDMTTLYGMTADTAAHDSRPLVHEAYVVPADEVVPLA